MYIVPPLDDSKPGVADLYREGNRDGDERWWLVATPSCDLEHDKAEFVVLAACIPVADDDRLIAWRQNDNNPNRSKVRDLVAHNTGGQLIEASFFPRRRRFPIWWSTSSSSAASRRRGSMA